VSTLIKPEQSTVHTKSDSQKFHIYRDESGSVTINLSFHDKEVAKTTITEKEEAEEIWNSFTLYKISMRGASTEDEYNFKCNNSKLFSSESLLSEKNEFFRTKLNELIPNYCIQDKQGKKSFLIMPVGKGKLEIILAVKQ